MAEDLHIGAEFLTALGMYAQAANQAVQEASALGMRSLQEDLRETARNHPRWHQAADHIQVWAQDGRLIVGVGAAGMSEAMSAEYGDASHPPIPIVRNHPEAARKATTIMNDHIRSIPGMEP